MRALNIVGERAIEVVDKPDPEPGPGELLIEMQASAICGSDLHIYRSPRQAFIDNAITPGHEGCGTVAAVGEGVEGWSVGDRAVVYFRRTCGPAATASPATTTSAPSSGPATASAQAAPTPS